MEALSRLDTQIFYLFNTWLATPALDYLMVFITRKANFIWPFAVLWLFIFAIGGRTVRTSLVMVLVAVLLSDFISTLLKGLFARPRPCQTLDGIRLLVGCGGSYSMPSGHATNIFAATVFLGLRFKKLLIPLLAVAFLVGLSRIYVGVHYPSDVVAGALLGSLIAVIFVEADRRAVPRLYEYIRKRKGSGEA